MRRIKVVYHYIDRDAQEQVTHYADDAFLICDGVALSVVDKERGDAVLERVKPSEMFPGCYESVDGPYTEFELDEDIYQLLLQQTAQRGRIA
ncbi:hypothetical protein PTHTG4_09780 [Parageobacillus thermoglucosidasius]|uniref:hypothetical protein n=1 Tax=Parageobacillus thermoglucosidasius TaxID=1426 RepID=UPI000F62763F|nr:hypothetical protein [Parageobacillus thermoglucosidasius]GCD81916.1 hypothetical protein PTHTG4_09780 [Parageobacillus thermoglucosidasius]